MQKPHHSRAFTFIFLLSLVLGVIFLTVLVQSRLNVVPQLIASAVSTPTEKAFPTIDETNLSPTQIKMIAVLREEYAAQPEGTKYSEGTSEPWCADFVSWVMRESGVPLENPNNGYWRIPGTYTLRDYYKGIGKFQTAKSGYDPQVGDIMLYDNPSPFGQHTNIIIKVEDGIVTTIGGNEPGGIRIVKHTTPDSVGFVGYGVL